MGTLIGWYAGEIRGLLQCVFLGVRLGEPPESSNVGFIVNGMGTTICWKQC